MGATQVTETPIFVFVVNGLVIGISLYIFTVQWIYYCRKSTNPGNRGTADHRMEVILVSVASGLPSIIVLSRYFLTMVFDDLLYISRFQAAVISNIIVLLYFISLSTCYCMLWLRQRSIYRNRLLSNSLSRLTKFISKYFVIYIITISLTLPSLLAVINLLEIFTSEIFFNIFVVSLLILPISCQLPLLCLMLVPLYKHHTGNLVSQPDLVTLMRRIVFFTTICVISDLMTVVVLLRYRDALMMSFDVNMIVNLLSVILTPIRWRVMAFPCFSH